MRLHWKKSSASPHNKGLPLTKEEFTGLKDRLLSLSTRPRFITQSLYVSLSIIAVLLPISNQYEEWTYRFHSPRMFTSGGVQETQITRRYGTAAVRAGSAAVIVNSIGGDYYSTTVASGSH